MPTDNCFQNLIGLKKACGVDNITPQFYLDDIEGIDQQRLADLATTQGSGKALANDIIDSSIRLFKADIDTVIPASFRIAQQITNSCSSCSYSGFYQNASAQGSGIIIKNVAKSKYSNLIINNLKVMVNSSGDFDLIITDGANSKTITHTYSAGQQVNFENINYITTAKQVKVYFNNASVSLAQIVCAQTSGCGCGQPSAPTDYVIAGYHMGAENTQQYAILPCVTIGCSYDSVVCGLVASSPRVFGLALLYLAASKIFENNAKSQRVNRTASFEQEDKKTDSEKFMALYKQRLTGSPAKGVLGIAQAINNNLALMNNTDKCVTCSANPIGVAWATG